MADDAQQLLQFINLQRVPVAIAILAGGLVLNRLALGFLDDMGERFGNQRLLFKKISALLRFSVYVGLFAITASSVLVLESDALIAVAGTIGVAVGFAFKDLLASLMAGVILLMDEPFQVGDRVAFGGYYGEISEIGLRSVRMVTLDDNLVTIPNNKFLNEASASANAGALDCMVVIPFYLGAAEDFVAARRLIEEATATSRYVFLDKPMSTLIADEFMGERFVTVVRVKAYVFDARYEKAFASDVTERVKISFREAGIRTPDQQYRDLDMNQREARV